MRRKCMSLEERLRLYDEVMRLRKQKLRYEQTAKAIGERMIRSCRKTRRDATQGCEGFDPEGLPRYGEVVG